MVRKLKLASYAFVFAVSFGTYPVASAAPQLGQCGPNGCFSIIPNTGGSTDNSAPAGNTANSGSNTCTGGSCSGGTTPSGLGASPSGGGGAQGGVPFGMVQQVRKLMGNNGVGTQSVMQGASNLSAAGNSVKGGSEGGCSSGNCGAGAGTGSSCTSGSCGASSAPVGNSAGAATGSFGSCTSGTCGR